MVVNSRLQDLFDGHTQPLPVLETQTSDRTRRAQPGKKQALARINVPYPYDYRCIHDKIFYWLVETLGTLEEISTGKRLGQRRGPQMSCLLLARVKYYYEKMPNLRTSRSNGADASLPRPRQDTAG